MIGCDVFTNGNFLLLILSPVITIACGFGTKKFVVNAIGAASDTFTIRPL